MDIQTELRRFSSLGRPVDPHYPTNRAIATLTLTVAAGGTLVGLLGGTAPPTALIRALAWSIGFFLAWAIAREVDPDHDGSAFVAAGLSLGPLWLYGLPGFAALVLALLALRIVNRSVGPAAKTWDTVLILGLIAWVAWQGHTVIGALGAVALLADALLEPPHRVHLLAAVIAAALLIAVGSAPDPVFARQQGMWLWIAVLALVPFLVLIRRSAAPRSISDRDARPLRGMRVRTAQGLALAAVIAMLGTEGEAGLAAISSLWAAVAGTGLYALFAGDRRSA